VDGERVEAGPVGHDRIEYSLVGGIAVPYREPTYEDIVAARPVVARHLPPTPLLHPARLSERLGMDLRLKCETLQPTGAFKVRGGVYLTSRLSADERARGVVASSTGNHGASIAFGARLFGTRATIFAPAETNPTKLANMRRLGAEVVQVGRDFDEAREAAERHAAATGARCVHSANEPDLIAGVGTYALEIADEFPDLDAVIVPVGGGSGLCGTAIVMKRLNPRIRVIGVQTEAMPVVYRSWREGRMLALEGGRTFADGLATRVAFELPFGIMRRLVDDIVLVSEDAMRRAIVELLETGHVMAEGAGAAPLAAARQLGPALRGQKVALVVSGGNLGVDNLRWVLDVDREAAA
jgi:threonine dehydratase